MFFQVGRQIEELLERQKTSQVAYPTPAPTVVPPVSGVSDGGVGRGVPSTVLTAPNVRRIEVLKSCLRAIFENQIADARKMLSAVQLSMKSQAVRIAFCRQLHENLYPQNRATLEPQQFDLLVRLMNCALQNESERDEHGVAYALLSLSHTYCRVRRPLSLCFSNRPSRRKAICLDRDWRRRFK